MSAGHYQTENGIARQGGSGSNETLYKDHVCPGLCAVTNARRNHAGYLCVVSKTRLRHCCHYGQVHQSEIQFQDCADQTFSVVYSVIFKRDQRETRARKQRRPLGIRDCLVAGARICAGFLCERYLYFQGRQACGVYFKPNSAQDRRVYRSQEKNESESKQYQRTTNVFPPLRY